MDELEQELLAVVAAVSPAPLPGTATGLGPIEEELWCAGPAPNRPHTMGDSATVTSSASNSVARFKEALLVRTPPL